MPTLSIVYGIKITMNYNDHSPPHFHAEYQEYEAIRGMMPIDLIGDDETTTHNSIPF